MFPSIWHDFEEATPCCKFLTGFSPLERGQEAPYDPYNIAISHHTSTRLSTALSTPTTTSSPTSTNNVNAHFDEGRGHTLEALHEKHVQTQVQNPPLNLLFCCGSGNNFAIVGGWRKIRLGSSEQSIGRVSDEF
ncbi:hypothetical protein E2542_SST16720 [Spatholobus suberectus]|nr:hypothetical protein E2542_SST16720 [Spatholobus suberectus]